MTKILRTYSARILVFFTILILAARLPSYARVVDKIVAVVNDEVITQAEVDKILYPLYQQYSEIYKTDKELYKKLDESRVDILRQLVHDRLILSEARKLNITVEEREIDERLEMVKKGLAEKEESFNDLLKEQNLSIGDLCKKYEEQIMIEKTIDREVRSTIEIQPSEIDNYYTEHIEDYTQHQQVAVYTILIKLKSQRTPLESRQLTDDIHKMIADGGDFRELAKNYSEGPYRETGGDLGYVTRGQMLKEIDDVIFSLKVDEVSDVIESPIGYHICKAYERKEGKVVPLQEIRQKVSMSLYKAKVQERFEDWLEKIKSDAYISIK
ncbi:peptidylprolyl isomerase [Omnitrophica bacterium]|nr:peptidylprolyl isomerase [Candidatus Omnitrophota bacterium]